MEEKELYANTSGRKKLSTKVKVLIGIGAGCGCLVTMLPVIGIIAAMVIPVLLGSTNDHEYETAYKKASATLNQALSMSIALDAKDAKCQNCTDQDLAKIFKDKLNVINEGPNPNTFVTADGMKMTFTKRGSGACGSSRTNDPNDPDVCMVLVDVNGDKTPNIMSDKDTYKDQYYFIINPRTVEQAGNMPNLLKRY